MDHRDEQGNELFHRSLFNTVSDAELRPNAELTDEDPRHQLGPLCSYRKPVCGSSFGRSDLLDSGD